MLCDTCGGGSVDDYILVEVWVCNECATLLTAVQDTLGIARHIGVPKYGPSSWRNVSVQEHLEHASKHIYQARRQAPERLIEGMIIDDNEDHIAHAICRLVMAKALTNGS